MISVCTYHFSNRSKLPGAHLIPDGNISQGLMRPPPSSQRGRPGHVWRALAIACPCESCGTAWRRAGVRTQTPLTRCIPAPHASRISASVLSGGGGASGIACTDDTRATAKAVAINLVMFSSQCGPGRVGDWRGGHDRDRPSDEESRIGLHV